MSDVIPGGATDSYQVVWPSGKHHIDDVPDTREMDIADSVIAYVSDYMFMADRLFQGVTKELRSQFPTVGIVGEDYFGNLHSGHDELEVFERLPERFVASGAVAVVGGVGA